MLLLLAKIGPRLWTVAWTDSALAFLPLSGFSAWFIVATSACVGLFRRSRRAWTAALALMAVSAALLSYLLYVAAHVRGMDFHTLVLVSALVCFLSPLLLLLAGRHADLAPAGG